MSIQRNQTKIMYPIQWKCHCLSDHDNTSNKKQRLYSHVCHAKHRYQSENIRGLGSLDG